MTFKYLLGHFWQYLLKYDIFPKNWGSKWLKIAFLNINFGKPFQDATPFSILSQPPKPSKSKNCHPWFFLTIKLLGLLHSVRVLENNFKIIVMYFTSQAIGTPLDLENYWLIPPPPHSPRPENEYQYQPSGEGGTRSMPAPLHLLPNPKWPTGSGKMSTPRFLGVLNIFC